MPHNPKCLDVLEKSKALAILVHRAGRKYSRQFSARAPSLRGQLFRAVDSIVLNLSEGSGKDSPNGFVYFLDIAIASCNEVEVQLELAIAYGALPVGASVLLDRVIEVRKMSIGLKKAVLARPFDGRARPRGRPMDQRSRARGQLRDQRSAVSDEPGDVSDER